MEEEWRQVAGYEGIYEVSNLGNVYSHVSKRNLKNQIDWKGYVRMSLTKNRINTKARLHRLVAIAFIDNPDNYLEVNHKDEIKLNNYANNLEWCTTQYNNSYGTKRERLSAYLKGHAVSEETRLKISQSNLGKKGVKGAKNNRSKPILQYDLDMNFINRYESIGQAAKLNSFNHSAIICCCQGKYKKYKSSIWIYE